MAKCSMRIGMVSAISLLLLFQAGVALAETCDAGHGCSITCADGCSAVYNEDTGQCSKACGAALSAAEQKGRRGHISAVFRDTPRANIDTILKGLDKQAPARK